MAINGTWKNQALSLSLKPNSLTISLQSQGQNQVFSFDGAGRLIFSRRGGTPHISRYDIREFVY